jgi:anti-anti-sigma factor
MVRIELEKRDDVCIVRVSGRIVAGADTDELRGKADEAKRLGCSRVLADFSDVSAIGSTGVAFVVGLYTSVSKLSGGRFVLAGASRRVREVLDLTRVSTVIPLADDVDAGLAALRRP